MASQPYYDVSPEEFVRAVAELSPTGDGEGLYVRLLFPGGNFSASGFQLQVDEPATQILLLRRLPSGLDSVALIVSLPRLEEGWYRKAVSGTDEVFLSVAYPACEMTIPAMVELQIATSLDFLDLVTNAAPMQ